MKKPLESAPDSDVPLRAERTLMIPLENVSQRARAPSNAGRPRPALQQPAAAPTPPEARREWRPYRFPNLEKVTKQHVALLRRLEWMLPNVRSTGEVSDSVRQRLQEMLEEQVSLSVEYVHIVPPSKVRQYLGEPTFLAVLAPQPNKTRGLLEVEIGLAHTVIDMCLGGAGEAVALRTLTDIEEGVMTYVIIETLKALAPSMDPSLPKLRVESIPASFDDALSLLGEVENLAVVQLKAIVGQQSGYLRLFIPESVLSTANPPADAAVRRARRSAEAAAHGGRLRALKTHLRCELGQVDIMAADLEQLREKDVVLVDSLSLRPDQRAAAGTCRLRVGLGRSGSMSAAVALVDGRYQATVQSFAPGLVSLDPRLAEEQNPEEHDGEAPADDAGSASAATEPDEPNREPRGNPDMENQADAGDLLNDIPLQLMVELGRVAMNAEEVVSLKVGHVIDLNRQAGEPLDLSVNGKVVARGEVVEIDGALGIRIVALAG